MKKTYKVLDQIVNRVFKHHSDPGHGWLAVKKQDLITLGIADKITYHSFTKGQTVYLEEDCDAGLFVKAYKEMFCEEPKMKTLEPRNSSHPIRSYKRYSAVAAKPAGPANMYFVRLAVAGKNCTYSGWYGGNTEQEAIDVAVKAKLKYYNDICKENVSADDISVVESSLSGKYETVKRELETCG